MRVLGVENCDEDDAENGGEDDDSVEPGGAVSNTIHPHQEQSC